MWRLTKDYFILFTFLPKKKKAEGEKVFIIDNIKEFLGFESITEKYPLHMQLKSISSRGISRFEMVCIVPM